MDFTEGMRRPAGPFVRIPTARGAGPPAEVGSLPCTAPVVCELERELRGLGWRWRFACGDLGEAFGPRRVDELFEGAWRVAVPLGGFPEPAEEVGAVGGVEGHWMVR
jgi:hypothetical protein